MISHFYIFSIDFFEILRVFSMERNKIECSLFFDWENQKYAETRIQNLLKKTGNRPKICGNKS